MSRGKLGSPIVDIATVSAALAGIGFGLVSISYYVRYYYCPAATPSCPTTQFAPFYPYQSLEAPGIFLIFLGLDLFVVLMLRLTFKSFSRIYVVLYVALLLGIEMSSLESIVSFGTCFANYPYVCPSQYYLQSPLFKGEVTLGNYLIAGAGVGAVTIVLYAIYEKVPELWKKRMRRLLSKR
jgi:hypothetical protein